MLTQLSNRVPVLIKSLFDRKMDATELLTQDHLKVERLFLQLKFLNQVAPRIPSRKTEFKKRREALFEQIRDELERHTHAEESIFYPECEKLEELKALVNESYEEHKQVKTLLSEMRDLSIDNETFEAKFTLLIENVSHHVREEEENLFPKVRRLISRTRLERMASQMRTRKRHKKGSAAA
jgi:iron-sulfur cluster repair protein YtfE (RIC family)